jgi:hypothetical protein
MFLSRIESWRPPKKKKKKEIMQTTTCCKPINYLNTNGTKKQKMNNKIQHVWKQWNKFFLQQHKKIIGMENWDGIHSLVGR